MAKKRAKKKEIGAMQVFTGIMIAAAIVALAYALYKLFRSPKARDFLKTQFEENKELISELIANASFK